MNNSPIARLVRLSGGVALLSGPLGHQALGQLLISRSTAVEVAGANVALAAVMRHSNVAVQLVVNTVVPALAVESLSRSEERRLERERARLERLAQEQGTAVDQRLVALAEVLPEEVIQALAANERRRLELKQAP
jgi:hypothetical protein